MMACFQLSLQERILIIHFLVCKSVRSRERIENIVCEMAAVLSLRQCVNVIERSLVTMLIFVALMTPRNDLLALDVYLIKSFMGMKMSPFIHTPPRWELVMIVVVTVAVEVVVEMVAAVVCVVVDRVVWERIDSWVYSFFHSNNRCKTCEYVYVALVQYIFRNKNTACLNILSKI